MKSEEIVVNVAEHKLAEAMLEMVGLRPLVFYRAMVEMCNARLPQAPAPVVERPMTEIEALAFEERIIPFGVFQHRPVYEATCEYLANLADPSPFMDDLRRYLKTHRFKQRHSKQYNPLSKIPAHCRIADYLDLADDEELR